MDHDHAHLSISELRKRCQSNAPEAGRDPLIGHSIRFLSIYFTKAFLYTSITPLWVTIISVALFLLGMALFALNDILLSFIGIGIVYVSILLDGTNGELARLQGYKPEIGARYIEPLSHDIQYGLMFIPLMINAYINTGSLYVIYAGFIATVAKLINRFLIVRFDNLRASDSKNADTEGEARIPFNPNVNIIHKTYRFLNRNFFSSVGLVIPLFICTAYNRIDLFVWLFAIVYTAFALAHFFKQMAYVMRVDKPSPTHELS